MCPCFRCSFITLQQQKTLQQRKIRFANIGWNEKYFSLNFRRWRWDMQRERGERVSEQTSTFKNCTIPFHMAHMNFNWTVLYCTELNWCKLKKKLFFTVLVCLVLVRRMRCTHWVSEWDITIYRVIEMNFLKDFTEQLQKKLCKHNLKKKLKFKLSR